MYSLQLLHVYHRDTSGKIDFEENLKKFIKENMIVVPGSRKADDKTAQKKEVQAAPKESKSIATFRIQVTSKIIGLYKIDTRDPNDHQY